MKKDYIVLDTQQTKYGEVYFVIIKASKQNRTLWDLVDIVIIGKSWAVTDTAAILLVLPSSAYMR